MPIRVATILLFGLASGALAPAPAAAQGEAYIGFSDTATVPSPEEAVGELRAIRPVVCPRGTRPVRVRRLPKSQAIARADAFLRRRAGRSAYRRLLRSEQTRRAAAAEDLAAASVAANAPAAGLAGFLAAHRREPRNPRHLLNAAVLLVKFRMPSEALALTAAAERLPRPRTAPMGIDLRALAANNRGFALLTMRRYAEAERHLRAAITREPLLSEANLNLAAARLCAGRLSQAVEPYIAGKRRNKFSNDVSAAGVRAAAGSALDLSLGVDGVLPAVRIPQTSNDAVASYPGFQATHDRRYAQATTQYETANNALVALGLSFPPGAILQAQRTGQILDLWNQREAERPQLRSLLDAIKAKKAELDQNYGDWVREEADLRTACQDQGGTSAEVGACIRSRCIPMTQGKHARWAELMAQNDATMREWAREVYRYASAISANLANPAARAAILEAARHQIFTIYASYLTGELALWTGVLDAYKEDCVESGGSPQAEEGDFDLGPGLACPPELKGVKFGFKLPPFFSIGVSCEVISVEASHGAPVGPFAQVKYGIASGTTTVFAGAKAGGSIPGLSASGRAGIQMTFDGSGRITDTGLRATGSVSGPSLPGVGGPELSGQLDYSLAGTVL